MTGLNPLAALSQHLADPLGTTIFSKASPATCIWPGWFARALILSGAGQKSAAAGASHLSCHPWTALNMPWAPPSCLQAVVVPGQAIVPPCAIPETVTFQGVTIPAGCFLHSLWQVLRRCVQSGGCQGTCQQRRGRSLLPGPYPTLNPSRLTSLHPRLYPFAGPEEAGSHRASRPAP